MNNEFSTIIDSKWKDDGTTVCLEIKVQEDFPFPEWHFDWKEEGEREGVRPNCMRFYRLFSEKINKCFASCSGITWVTCTARDYQFFRDLSGENLSRADDLQFARKHSKYFWVYSYSRYVCHLDAWLFHSFSKRAWLPAAVLFCSVRLELCYRLVVDFILMLAYPLTKTGSFLKPSAAVKNCVWLGYRFAIHVKVGGVWSHFWKGNFHHFGPSPKDGGTRRWKWAWISG